MHKTLQPASWPRPRGYANGIAASGTETIYTGGLVGWDAEGRFAAGDFVAQVRTTLENIVAVLAEADAGPEQAYRDVIGRHFPAMAVVQVVALMEDDAMVEIEATAVR